MLVSCFGLCGINAAARVPVVSFVGRTAQALAAQVLIVDTSTNSEYADYEKHILRILGEAAKPLYPSEITEIINRELEPDSAYSRSEVMTSLQALTKEVIQLIDGRWMIKP
jgi:hypothetical protein